MSAKSKAQEFLSISTQFQLGHLVTESFHPLTRNLSRLAQDDIFLALKMLECVDHRALEMMQERTSTIWQMALAIQDTLKSGHKVYMCGCGATGRLSLVLETLHRQKFGATEQVFSFMAGGDFALIKSVESFEDRVEYGERQLLELGFGPNDLLLAPTEGGETPFVIGATHLAAQISRRSPYFLYCNPDELLMPIERSRKIIEDPKICKVNLTVGPMAISGSTRMQASTVLMLAIGVGLLFEHQDKVTFEKFFSDYLLRLKKTDYGILKRITQKEAALYKKNHYLNYISDSRLAMSILTDTTERSPTFSLKPFENRLEPGESHGLSYLFIPDAENSQQAWSELLWRKPRLVEWEELQGRIGFEKFLGFDISEHGRKARSQKVPTVDFTVTYDAGRIRFVFEEEKLEFFWGQDFLFNHLMIKMLLNAHSTLVMGILNRYDGNVMTWVKASNNKLIDRAARYILQILSQQGKRSTYEEVVHRIFQELPTINENSPIVLKVLASY